MAADTVIDEVFFREWDGRSPGEGRSLHRARALAGVLRLPDPDRPVLAVVGSKGKGTAAVYASAVLAAAGLKVGTVTSPAYRTERERIRVNGQAIGPDGFRALAARLDTAMRALTRPVSGYLSPSGLFLLAGALHARDADLDVLVLEAGMGGRSDEISLFPATAVAITPVFGEHLGVLGGTPAEIAREKAAIAGPHTRAVVSAPQPGDVAEAVAATAPQAETLAGSGLPADLLPDGLARTGAETGHLAALRLLEALGEPAPPPGRLRATLATVSLPGRLSWHPVPGTETLLLADSAIERAGIAAALDAARARWGTIDHVLLCLPDHKDVDGAIAGLGDLPVTFVRLPHGHLRFSRPLPRAWRVIDAADLTRAAVAGLGRRVVALGTVYFRTPKTRERSSPGRRASAWSAGPGRRAGRCGPGCWRRRSRRSSPWPRRSRGGSPPGRRTSRRRPGPRPCPARPRPS
jgi:dihydrofolate synthase/folylpolyglutamate synthase